MRSAIIRKLFGIVGLSLCGYAIGTTFAWALAAATLGMFLQFIWLLITAILALISAFKFVMPAVEAWVNGEPSAWSPKSVISRFKAGFNKEATA